MKPGRIVVNIVGGMLFVQVILGGLSTVLNFPVIFHIIWGVITFVALIIATVLIVRDYGRGSAGFKIGVVAIVDYVVQGILGFFSLGSNPAIVIHLTNAFLLAVLATYLISFADRAEQMKPTTTQAPYPTTTA
jgi:heme A synthase